MGGPNWTDVKDLKPGLYWATDVYLIEGRPEIVQVGGGDSLYVNRIYVTDKHSGLPVTWFKDYYGPIEPPPAKP